ncbi:hypothetical protein M8J77_016718 [Diaphorina citri]|nr:hypothetical protein M8J77_016718 [Diaphorina citri]
MGIPKMIVCALGDVLNAQAITKQQTVLKQIETHQQHVFFVWKNTPPTLKDALSTWKSLREKPRNINPPRHQPTLEPTQIKLHYHQINYKHRHIAKTHHTENVHTLRRARAHPPSTQQHGPSKLEAILEKQSLQIENLLQQMGKLMGLLTTLVTKLCK